MDLLDYAIGYQKLGWSVIPIVPPAAGAKDYQKKPHVRWKEFMERAATEKELMQWWRQWPAANVGTVTGKVSNLVSLDIDSMAGKMQYQEHIGDLPNTITQRTGGGPDREQYLFRFPKQGIGNYVDIFENKSGVDIRGDKGYIVVPPSIHKTGRLYSWNSIDPLEMGLDDLCEFPEDLLIYLRALESGAKKKNQANWQDELLLGVSEGRRHAAMMKLCGYWLYDNQDKEKTYMLLEGWNTRNNPPLEKSELRIAVENIAKREGVNELSLKTNVYFEDIVYYHSIDGNSTWTVKINGKKYDMEADDFRNQTKFGNKIANMTGEFILSVKKPEWEKMMQKLFKECRREEKKVEDTIYAPVIEVLEDMINNSHNTPSLINKTSIIIDDEFYVKSKVLLRKFDKLEKVTRTTIKQALERLGFTYDNSFRDEIKSQHKIWHINKNTFKDNIKNIDM